MNTPEPFSKTRNSNSQPQRFYPPGSGQPVETNTPHPFNPTFPPQSQTQIGGHNSGYLSPANPFATSAMSSPPTTNNWGNNQWTNGVGTANRAGGPGGFSPPNTPIPPNNNTSLNAKPPRRGDTTKVGKILLFLGLALLVVTAGATGFYLFQGNSTGAASTAKKMVIVKPTPKPTPTPTVHMQHQQLATQYIANMSLDDEIAQLLMVEQSSPYYSPDLNIMINQQHVGSVILYETAIQTRPQTQAMNSQIQSNAKIPVFISVDEEGRSLWRLANLYGGNHNYRKDADDIQATGDPNVATTEGQSVAKDLLSLGINMNAAPDVDISGSQDYIGHDGRSFGTTSDQVIKYAGPYLKALQNNGIVGVIKHFPGIGSVIADPHAVLPTYPGTKNDLYQTDLVPFQHFISDTDPYQQAQVVMPTDMLVKSIDSTYPAELSHTFITDILRNQMGFKGVILTDSLHMGGVVVDGQTLSLTDPYVIALEAGNDILEGASTSDLVQSIIDAIKAAVQSGKLTKAQIDASVIRILTLKMDFNVMPATLK
jgi:beta-N-acetylhexosaminidase